MKFSAKLENNCSPLNRSIKNLLNRKIPSTSPLWLVTTWGLQPPGQAKEIKGIQFWNEVKFSLSTKYIIVYQEN